MDSPTPFGGLSSPISSLPSTPNDNPSAGFPDYSVWTPERWAAYPGLSNYHDPHKECVWWWKYGYRLRDPTRPKNQEQIWVCETCFLARKAPKDCKFVAGTSRSIIGHLKDKHGVQKENDKPISAPASQRTLHSMVDFSQPQQQALHGHLILRFKKQLNDLLVLDWLTSSNLPFTVVDNPRWRRQQLYNNPAINEKTLPHSKTITRLLLSEYQRAVPLVKAFLRTARGLIHLTFDGWTSRKFTSFVGIHAHFIDKDFKRWTILLGLPALLKRHTGSDVADEVLAIIRFFGIEDIVGYCTLDNESKNGVAMIKIGQQLGFDGEERQIRCAPHALQLAVRALLYGEGCKRLPLDEVLANWCQDSFANEDEENDALDCAFEEVGIDLEDDASQQDPASEDEDMDKENLSNSDLFSNSGESVEEEESHISLSQVNATLEDFDCSTPNIINTNTMAKYQKKGPFGKLHNHGNCFHRSSQLVGALHAAQKKINPLVNTKEWVHNNTTRWQSDEAMAARALLLQPAIKRLHQNLQDEWELSGSKEKDKPPLLEFRLGPQDWRVVEAIQNILAPFKYASKKLQGNGPASALDQYFPQMELLLLHLESCALGDCYLEREDPTNPAGPPLQENVRLFASLGDQERRFLKVYIKVGLWKLQRFYNKLTNLAYAAAVIFNPSIKMTGLQGIFDAEPQRQQPSWRDHYMAQLRKRWEDDYKNRPLLDITAEAEINQQPVLTMLQRRKRFYANEVDNEIPASYDIQSTQPAAKRRKGRGRNTQLSPVWREDTQQDELDQYLSYPMVNIPVYLNDPVAWWRDIGAERFPRLSYMAVDFLTIPSAQAEAERQFSSVGEMISARRSCLTRHIVGASQCIRSWSKAGVYQAGLPLHLLDQAPEAALEGTISRQLADWAQRC